MRVSDRELAPRVLEHPGTRPTEKWVDTVDERILAQRAQPSPTDRQHKGREERRSCFYCLEGWVFLGSLDHEAIRCRRCKGTARINR
jgi:uncharacterized paraquat-inducible protein A